MKRSREPLYYQGKTPVSEIVTSAFLREVYKSLPEEDQRKIKLGYKRLSPISGLGFSSYLETIFSVYFRDEIAELNRRIREKNHSDNRRSARRARAGVV